MVDITLNIMLRECILTAALAVFWSELLFWSPSYIPKPFFVYDSETCYSNRRETGSLPSSVQFYLYQLLYKAQAIQESWQKHFSKWSYGLLRGTEVYYHQWLIPRWSFFLDEQHSALLCSSNNKLIIGKGIHRSPHKNVTKARKIWNML